MLLKTWFADDASGPFGPDAFNGVVSAGLARMADVKFHVSLPADWCVSSLMSCTEPTSTL